MGVGLSLCSPTELDDLANCTPSKLSKLAMRHVSGTAADRSSKGLVLKVGSNSKTAASSGCFGLVVSAKEQLLLEEVRATGSLDSLAHRFQEGFRERRPHTARFQAPRRYWEALATSSSGKSQHVILSCPILPKDRTDETAQLDLEDARDVAGYATRFNLFHRNQADQQVPLVKVAMPVSCTVQESCFPAMIPVGTVCTVTPSPCGDIEKMVIEGCQEFDELAHAFFHYTAFTSNGKHFAYDLQGVRSVDGDLTLVDPCLLRSEKMSIGTVVQASIGGADHAVQAVSTSVRTFDELHPHCTELCHGFDPLRKSAKRKAGVCGTGISCGL